MSHKDVKFHGEVSAQKIQDDAEGTDVTKQSNNPEIQRQHNLDEKAVQIDYQEPTVTFNIATCTAELARKIRAVAVLESVYVEIKSIAEDAEADTEFIFDCNKGSTQYVVAELTRIGYKVDYVDSSFEDDHTITVNW